MLSCFFPFQLSASNNQLVRMFQVAKLHHLKVSFSLLFPSFTIIITLIIPSSSPSRSSWLLSQPSPQARALLLVLFQNCCILLCIASICWYIFFCVILHFFCYPYPVNFNLWEYNNPPISNWSFAQWLCPILVVFCLFHRWFKAA